MTNTPLNPDALANLRLLADRATEEVRHAVIEPDILHKLLDLAVAQPVVDETALANLIAWKSLPFGATQFVKLDANAAHKVIELLKPHLAVAQPEVNSAVEAFINQRPEYITALKNTRGTDDQSDYWRWQGHAESRRQLAQSLGWTVPHNPGEATSPEVKP